MAKIIDGKAVSAAVRQQMKQEVAELTERGVRPGLAVVIVGDDPASRVYVNNKKKACAEIGIYSEEYALTAATTEEELLELCEMGTSAAILGKSLYTGALNLASIIKKVQE